MLKTIISMQGQSIDKELFEAHIDATDSAFIQQRQKLNDNLDETFMKQEIFANLIAYNFCSAIAMTVKIRNYNSKKYDYKIDFAFAFHVIKEYLRDFSKSPPERIDTFISKKICPVRKDRVDERKIRTKNVIPFMYRVA